MGTTQLVLMGLFLGAGCFFALTGAVGLLRMPDFYSRLHAAGKADTLAQTFCISSSPGPPQLATAAILRCAADEGHQRHAAHSALPRPRANQPSWAPSVAARQWQALQPQSPPSLSHQPRRLRRHRPVDVALQADLLDLGACPCSVCAPVPHLPKQAS